VAILVPDLATYAPLVEAVFATSAPGVTGRRRGSLPLPVHVADPPRGTERHVLDAFDRLLGLLDGRATASDVLGLLDVPAVRRAAGIDESEIATVHAWVRLARVHWGRDAAHRTAARPDEPETGGAAEGDDDGDLHTWRFGLDRLLLGVMTGPTDAVVLGRRPVGEGTLDAADLLGRLAEWLDALFAALDTLRAPRPLAAWADALLLFADLVLAPEGTDETTAVVALRAAADRLATLRPTASAPADEPAVALGEVQAHLGHALATLDRDEPYLTGRITVVDPTAARGVPFRVIAIVGLGDAFPRSESRPAFDLLAVRAEPGDPDPAGTDRQTFLDAVLATRDRLVLSYTGRSQRDGTERAASSALDALLDTCAATFVGADRLVVRHRLQPFSPAYFRTGIIDGDALFTYAAQNRRSTSRPTPPQPFFEPPARDVTVGEPGGPPVETTLDALAAAWAHPSRAFCSARGLRPDLADADLRDDAPAELDALDLYAVKDGLLALLAAGETPASAYAALRGTGVLPPGPLGRAWFDHAHGLVAAVAERAGRVAGTLAIAPGGVLRVRASRVRPRDLVRGWVDHLAASAAETPGAGRTTVVGQDRSITFSLVPADAARATLQALVRGALAFEHAPVPLFEHASHAYAEAMWKMRRPDMTRSAEALVASEAAGWRAVRVGQSFAARAEAGAFEPALVAARKAYDDPYAARCDAQDPYIALCYRHLSPADAFPDALDRWARTLWAPLMGSLGEA
jgi:exodeoxyribonuclease V gamma subunit